MMLKQCNDNNYAQNDVINFKAGHNGFKNQFILRSGKTVKKKASAIIKLPFENVKYDSYGFPGSRYENVDYLFSSCL